MSRMLVDKDAIRALADILTETGLTEIEISESDSRIRVARNVSVVQAAAPAAAPAAPAAPVAAVPVAAPADPAKHPGMVPSPMVGVAYLTPDPASPPFAVEGQPVAAGQTIMLIEAMKTFNQIKAPRAGTLTKFLVESGQPVEFGEALAIIE
ncbi:MULTISPECIES: acetyl-CoA carboxylase biotin carboxyl carrier protein [Gluconobacter]|nr:MULTISPECIES: acetyl-CoA carboxylase biotin carboxyl carrier protein subunit [Gluconobacter]KXV00916.1 acetyl-CoA carboxylase [Gluconobacter potus]KXV13014.1 acetyl-CoA carboxylase [Gluconobacter oxydans]KXV30677.1 acetyl-CoA carboxylase [Gluconobacter oxydans]KXV64407.1 acetyl-CoA carboxylase [Gluconobacter oxydans]MBF0856719.1 acetyl-CoA carboxylase biotin carboxyl carrier protein subunit [Gluconobacter oxydans]